MRRLSLMVAVVAGMLVAVAGTAHAEHETSASAEVHVVQQGDWLWKIAREQLRQSGTEPAPSAVQAQAEMIYQDNRAVIGPDRNRLRPGQRLRLRPMATLLLPPPCSAPPGSGCA